MKTALDYFEAINKKTAASKDFNKIKRLFGKYRLKISNNYDAIELARRGLPNSLTDELYESIDSYDLRYRTIVLDILICSKFNKQILAKYIIDIIYKTIDDDIDQDLTWFFCDDLRMLKQLRYTDCYIEMLSFEKLGSARQLIVDLLACSNKNINDTIVSYIDDYDLTGHILEFLYKRNYKNILELAVKYTNDDREYVRNVANAIIMDIKS